MTTKREFELEFRAITGYGEDEVSNGELEVLMSRAEKHIRSERSGLEDDYDFLENPKGEEVLFWFTCLFSKVAAGELDSQTVQVGAVEPETLLAKDDDSVTEWYRKARAAMRNFRHNERFTVASPARTDRVYTGGSGGINTSSSTSTEVDSTDL